MGGAGYPAKSLPLAVLSVVGFLLLLEITLRLAYPLDDNYYTLEWQYGRELKQVVSNEPFLFDHRPDKVMRVYDTELTLNSQGMRDREFPLKKPYDRTRIAIVGDSTTLGWGVPLEQTYPKLLEQFLGGEQRGVEVLNFGVGNYNTFQEYHKIERDVLSYSPDIILLQFYINDLEGMDKPSPYWLREKSYAYLFFWQKVAGVKNRVGHYDAIGYHRALYTKENEHLAQNKESLEKMAALCKERNITLYVVLIPELQTFDEGLARLQKEFVTDVVGEDSVIDLTPDFKPYSPEQLHISGEDMHLNAAGHRILAESLDKRMRELI